MTNLNKAERNGRIVKMYAQGMSCAEIAPFFGLHKTTIKYALKSCGIKLRTRQESNILKAARRKEMNTFLTESISASTSKPTIGFQSDPKQETPEQKNAQELQQAKEKFEKITARIISTTNPAPSAETPSLLPEDREYMEAKYKKLLCKVESLQSALAEIDRDIAIVKAILGK